MQNDFEYSGIWFLPEDENNEVSGKLIYSAKDGITLELIGSFEKVEDIFKDKNPIIILGYLANGKKITLLYNHSISKIISFPGVPIVIYKSFYLFIGEHYKRLEDLLFNSIEVNFNNLENWLNFNGNKVKYFKNGINLFYRKPLSIEFNIENLKGEFEFTATTKYKGSKNYQISQKVILSLESKTLLNFREFLNKIQVFQDFLTFGYFETSIPLSINLFNNNNYDEYANKKIEKPISLLYSLKNIFFETKERQSHEFLFYYEDISDNFETTINKWFTLNKEIEPIINLFLESFYSINEKFNENKFLNMIHALETFHRRLRKNNVLNKKDFKLKISSILFAVPEEQKDWLKERLNFANEPTLNSRLTELISEIIDYKIIQKIIVNENIFIKQIRDTRNYYTHYNSSLEKKALKGSNLYYSTMKLRVILIIHLLLLLGLKKEAIEKIIERNEHKYFSNLFNNEE